MGWPAFQTEGLRLGPIIHTQARVNLHDYFFTRVLMRYHLTLKAKEIPLRSFFKLT